MAALSRTAYPLLRYPRLALCLRSFSTNGILHSGHNRWSKIRHEKGAADAKKNAQRSQFTQNLTLYSKLYGPDPEHNPQLAATIYAAKKGKATEAELDVGEQVELTTVSAGVPKSTIEGAVSRGQGRLLDGASLSSLTFEAIMSPSIALIIDVETDNKLRAIQDLNQVLKKHKATTGPSKFLFSRLGRVVFEKGEPGIGADEILDSAVEAGAEDLDTDEAGNIVVWTAPTLTSRICQAIEGAFGLKILSSDIIWSPNEDTKVRIDSPTDLQRVAELVVALRECPDVQAIYCNASRGHIAEGEWALLEDNLDV